MPLSRSFKIASLGALWAMLSSASGWANEPAPATSQCTGCHQGALALDKFNADELTEKIKGMLADPAGHPPLQGEHTREILLELGYDEDAIETLRGKGVIG